MVVATWLALRTTIPAPVRVTVEPETVAGPLTTLYVTGPLEADVALTVKGALPYVCDAMDAKVNAGTA